MAQGIRPLLGRMLFALAIAMLGAPGCGADEPEQKPERRIQESLSAAQIVGVVSAINQAEIRQAQIALGRLEDAEVRAYADLTIREHQDAEKKLETLRAQLGVEKDESDLEKETELLGQNMIRHIERENDGMVDQTYLDVQWFMHRKGLAIVSGRLLPAATQPELRVYLEDLQTMLRKHLRLALKLYERYPPVDPGL